MEDRMGAELHGECSTGQVQVSHDRRPPTSTRTRELIPWVLGQYGKGGEGG